MKWKITKLKEHPKQAVIFGDVSDVELAALAADMEQRGQRDPVEILADGTIVAGHQRVRAAKMLGWTEIDIVVRTDLDGASSDTIEAELIGDNLYRRHLSPLSQARCIARLMEIHQGNRSGRLSNARIEELKGKIGRQLRMSIRNVNRYMLVLKAPTAVQQAFDRGEITLTNAGKLALLKAEAQEIAQRLHNGETAAAIVKHFLPKGDNRHKNIKDALNTFVGDLQQGIHDLDGRLDAVTMSQVEKHLAPLKKARHVIQRLIQKGET